MNVYSSNTAMRLPTSGAAFAAGASTTESFDEDCKLKARKLSSITGIMNPTNTTSPDYHGVGYGQGSHKKQRGVMLEGPPVTAVAVPLQHAAHTGRRANYSAFDAMSRDVSEHTLRSILLSPSPTRPVAPTGREELLQHERWMAMMQGSRASSLSMRHNHPSHAAPPSRFAATATHSFHHGTAPALEATAAAAAAPHGMPNRLASHHGHSSIDQGGYQAGLHQPAATYMRRQEIQIRHHLQARLAIMRASTAAISAAATPRDVHCDGNRSHLNVLSRATGSSTLDRDNSAAELLVHLARQQNKVTGGGTSSGSRPPLSQSVVPIRATSKELTGSSGAVASPSPRILHRSPVAGLIGKLSGAAMLPKADVPRCLPVVLSQAMDTVILSPHQAYLRSQIEIFEATEADIAHPTRGRNKRINVGQVGIRCRHCAAHSSTPRQKGSRYFPATILGLYQAAQNMSSNHIQCGLCTAMPNAVKDEFVRLIPSKNYSSYSGRTYWAESAKQMGLVDTEQGIMFAPAHTSSDGCSEADSELPS